MRFLCFLLLLATANRVYAQSFNINRFSTKDGLPNNCIYRVFQSTHSNYTWLGTDYGISRFDGNNFVNFVFHDTVSLNHILGIAEIGRDSLILSYYREGLYLFNKGILSKIPVKNSATKKETFNVIKLLKGTVEVWALTTSNSLLKYSNGTIKKINLNYKGVPLTPVSIAYTTKKGLIIGTKKGLYLYRNGVLTPGYSKELKEYRIKNIQTDNNKNLWFTNGQRISKISNDTTSSELHNTNLNTSDLVVKVDSKNRVWYSSPHKGIYVLVDAKKINLSQQYSLPKTIVNCIEEDDEGNIWVGTRSNGVYIITDYPFVKIKDHKKENIFGKVTAINFHKNKDSVVAIDGRVYLLKKEKLQPTTITTNYIDKEVYSVFYDSPNKQTLFACLQGVLIKKNNNVTLQKMPKAATSFCYIDNSRILVGSLSGIYELFKGEIKLSEYSFFNNKRINTLLKTKRDDLWVGTDEGLFRVRNGKVKSFLNTTTKIFKLITDGRNNLWVASNEGIYRISKNKIKEFGIESGLHQTFCTSLLLDSQKTLWVGTLNGLFYFDNKTQRFYAHNTPALFNDSREIFALADGGNGNLFIGTLSGLYKTKIETRQSNSKVNISSIQFNGITYFWPPKKIILPHKENDLFIEFTNSSFLNQANTLFEYKIEPTNSDWTVSQNNRVNFINLSSGKYTFKVRAINTNGNLKSEIKSIDFYVYTPFWKKKWFIYSIIIFSFLLVTSISLYTRLRIRKKRLFEDSISKLRLNSLNTLLNPHFISNILHSIIGYLENSKNKDYQSVKKYLSKFSELIRLNLAFANKSYIYLDDELLRLELYIQIEQYRFNNKFDYEINVDNKLNVRDIEIPNMIVQPFIENAIVHGLLKSKKKGKVTVNFIYIDDNTLQVEITDSGIGFNSTTAQPYKKSMGTKIVTERLKVTGQVHPLIIEDRSKYGETGTNVIMKLNID
jgi:ligand-binding sensor domain-containing protein/anti-sigma regulatory factor (Ser/Thr protein kinase)